MHHQRVQEREQAIAKIVGLHNFVSTQYALCLLRKQQGKGGKDDRDQLHNTASQITRGKLGHSTTSCFLILVIQQV